MANTQLTVTQNNTIGSLRGGGTDGGNIVITRGQTLTVNQTDTTERTYGGVISESGTTGRANFVKSGAGKLTLTRANTYTGTTTISNGILAISNSSALGTDTGETGRVTVDDGATLELAAPAGGPNLSLGKLLTLNGTGFNRRGALRNVSGANTWSGAITLGASAAIHNADTANTLTLGSATNGIGGATFTLTVGRRGRYRN